MNTRLLSVSLTVASLLTGSGTHTVAQVMGCTDPAANNYNSQATVNDGSCQYDPFTVTPVSSLLLDTAVFETSGLILWNGGLLTHNDNFDVNLYSLDTVTGSILSSMALNAVSNIDWEEISQDSNYIYVGDIGNNVFGNRTDLLIYRISKVSLLNNQPVIDTIQFNYSDQLNFNNAGMNNTDFDCEAFIVTSDSIFLFTKQWIGNKTKVYGLPKIPGSYSAQPVDSFDVQGLITGATYLEGKRLLVLSGYSSLLQPFLFVLYDFAGSPVFFSGNRRKISLNLPFHQVEGITTGDGLTYFLTNDYFTQPPFITTSQKLHKVDLDTLLLPYLSLVAVQEPLQPDLMNVRIYPNPATDYFYIEISEPSHPISFELSDMSGKLVVSGVLSTGKSKIDVSMLLRGIYRIRIGTRDAGSISIP